MSDPREVPRRPDSSSQDGHPANAEADNTKCLSTEEIHEFLEDSTLFRALPRKTLDRLTVIARPSTVKAYAASCVYQGADKIRAHGCVHIQQHVEIPAAQLPAHI